jgi:hypothetical protein
VVAKGERGYELAVLPNCRSSSSQAYWVAFAGVATFWVGERFYNKATTGKWHGHEALKPKQKKKEKPVLMKSRARLARLRPLFSRTCPPFFT